MFLAARSYAPRSIATGGPTTTCAFGLEHLSGASFGRRSIAYPCWRSKLTGILAIFRFGKRSWSSRTLISPSIKHEFSKLESRRESLVGRSLPPLRVDHLGHSTRRRNWSFEISRSSREGGMLLQNRQGCCIHSRGALADFAVLRSTFPSSMMSSFSHRK